MEEEQGLWRCVRYAHVSLWSAGHSFISNYLLNYFPGLDIERRNCHGFTALMKAAMQGRAECVRALMLAGMYDFLHRTHITHLQQIELCVSCPLINGHPFEKTTF